MDNNYFKEMAEEYFLKTEKGKALQNALNIFERVMSDIGKLAESEDGKLLKSLKIGTILTFGTIKKMAETGKKPNDFDKTDWIEIGTAVSDFAINMEPEKYTTFVFLLYAEYIDVSANSVKKIVPKEIYLSIKALATELRTKTTQLEKNTVTETAYIDDCLWISLDAMIKLLSATLSSLMGEDLQRFTVAVSTFSFEYARLSMYKKEQAFLNELLEHQNVVDEELKLEYEEFLKKAEDNANQFNQLINNAFAPDFRNSLKGSVALALAAGVDESEVLDSIEKIDDFFM